MVVKISKKSDVGSNKTQKHAIAVNCTAYTYKRPTGYIVNVMKPKIDCLSVTLHVHDEHRQAIPEGLWALVHDPDNPQYINSKAGYKGSSYYKTSICWVDPVTKARVLIQCQPTTKAKKGTAYLRFEFNPDQLGATGLANFKEQLPLILLGNGTWETIINEGCITRLDVAVDLVNVDVEDLLVATKKPGKKLSYFGLGGKIETAYQNTTKTIYIYDKRQKQLDDDLEPEYGGAPHTRVEIRTKTTKGILGLPTLMNHLKKVHLVDIEAPNPPEEVHHWKLFQNACRYKGVGGALKELPDPVSAQYKAAIAAIEKEVWQPDEIWDYWPETISKSGFQDV